MSKVEQLTVASALSLFSTHGLYMMLYSWLFGMSVWNTFFGGIIAFRTLPRQHFGNLQHKIFPIYFVLSVLLSSGLLLLWTFSHPDVLSYWDRPLVADVSQVYLLISVLLSQGSNYFIIGPMTSKTMFERHRLEKEEGKAYNEPGVSDAMKALNRRFGSLHGISSLLNLWSVIAIGMHGLFIGNAGVKGY
ncbi:hypothetical protein GYMLUDRAFT_66572 [Collybiopsis luxurians FD-317 M1]|nr:hypothetical protein GYMLUDRAFT_66572 [Collybiopsis luxurians FD-317 M1]